MKTFGLARQRALNESSSLVSRVSGEAWDVYSLAVVFVFIFSEEHPYTGLSNSEILHGVLEDGLRPSLAGVPEMVAELVQCMWEGDASARPTSMAITAACASWKEKHQLDEGME